MYKTMTAVFLFCLGLASTIANAEPVQLRKVIVCDSVENILRALKEDFEEEPLWHGKDLPSPSRYMLTVNVAKDTWTLIQYDDTRACVLGVGTGSKSIVQGHPV